MKHVPPPSGEPVEAFDNLAMAVSPAWHQAILRLANAAERMCEKLGLVLEHDQDNDPDSAYVRNCRAFATNRRLLSRHRSASLTSSLVKRPFFAKKVPVRTGGLMAGEALSPESGQQAALGMRRRLIFTLVAALILVGAGWLTLWAAGGSAPVAPTPHTPVASPASRRPSDELLETTKGLQVTQQQAVDQLQVVQDQLIAQQAETKKLSDQIVALTERLDALQQSIANIPASLTHSSSPPGPTKSR